MMLVCCSEDEHFCLACTFIILKACFRQFPETDALLGEIVYSNIDAIICAAFVK